jgi:hypothetical protein
MGELIDHVKLKQLSISRGKAPKKFLQGVAIDVWIRVLQEPWDNELLELCGGKILKGDAAPPLPYALTPKIPQEVHPYLQHPRP